MTDEIPRTGGNESQRDDSVRFIGKQNVARQLFLNEARIRLVFIERADHVIAKGPGV